MEQQYNSLLAIEQKKQELQKQIIESEKAIGIKWNNLFHKKEPVPTSPTQKFISMASNGAGIIDGLILGWKLYNKFKKK